MIKKEIQQMNQNRKMPKFLDFMANFGFITIPILLSMTFFLLGLLGHGGKQIEKESTALEDKSSIEKTTEPNQISHTGQQIYSDSDQ